MSLSAAIPPSSLPTYILSGGKSSRFGSDKARTLVDGRENILVLVDQLRRVGSEVTIVAQRVSDYQDLGVHTIADWASESGPLAGVLTALIDLEAKVESTEEGSLHHGIEPKSCWIVPCDLLVFRTEWIETLQRAHRSDRWITLFRSETFRPFPGIYSISLLGAGLDAWRRGVRSMRGLVAEVDASIAWVDVTDGDLPSSFNTRDEFERALRRESEA
ncbi:MAG: molybdenum cofactor guanylyltransferase [Planctomycetota bacterium]